VRNIFGQIYLYLFMWGVLFSRGGQDWRYWREKLRYPHLKGNILLDVIDTWAYAYKVRWGLPLGFGLMVLWDLQAYYRGVLPPVTKFVREYPEIQFTAEERAMIKRPPSSR